MNTFSLEILTPEKPFYRGDCISLVMPTGDGMLGIMANHSPLKAAVNNGRILYTVPDGATFICAVTRGMVSVAHNRVRILCESAKAPEEIDESAELEALRDAKLRLREKQSYEDFVVTQLALARAFNNLKVKEYSALHTNL